MSHLRCPIRFPFCVYAAVVILFVLPAAARAQTPAYWLGIGSRGLSEPLRTHAGLAEGEGLLICSIAAKGPADKAGVELYDVLLAVNGKKVGEAVAVDNVWAGQSDDPVELQLQRRAETLTISVVPETKPTEAPFPTGPEPPRHGVQHEALHQLGLELKPLSDEARKKLPSPYEGGVEVAGVRRDMPADQAGFREGDVVVALEIWQTRDLDDVEFVLDKTGGFNRFCIVRPSESGSTSLYGRMEVAGIAPYQWGMEEQWERTVSDLTSDRDGRLSDIGGVELALVEAQLSMISHPDSEEAWKRSEEERRRAVEQCRQLRERKIALESEVLVIEAQLALARRLAAQFRGGK